MNKNIARVSAILFFLVFLFEIMQIQGSFTPIEQKISEISSGLFGLYIVPFELLSLILVGGIIGMLYIAGRNE